MPIYWLNGAKAADQYEDFYDGSWDGQERVRHQRAIPPRTSYPWTGCDHDGTEAVTGSDSFALGTNIADARVGRPNSSGSGHGPLNGQTNRSDFQNSPLYGLSEVFQVATAVVVTNNPPTVANAIPDQSATAGTAFSYAFPANTFSDADTGDTLSYTATKADDTALPTWLAFAARTFSGTPTDAGMVALKVTASDGNGGSVSDTFDITVAADTTPPTLISATVVPNGSIMLFQFSENLDGSNRPPVSAFTVTAGGNTITNSFTSQVPGSPRGCSLVFASLYPPGPDRRLTYTDPTGGNANAIQDTAGNDVETFTTGMDGVPAVTNNSTVNTPATGAPTITGMAQVGQTLTATVGDIADVDGLPDPFLTDANTSFQWIRVATDNSETDISGAMAGAYTLVADDQGTTIKVKVSFTATMDSPRRAPARRRRPLLPPPPWSPRTGASSPPACRRRQVPAAVPLLHQAQRLVHRYRGLQHLHPDPRRGRPRRHPNLQHGLQGGRLHRRHRRPRHTYTTYTSTDKGVPIYWLNGAKAADQYEDFYDGSWDDEANDKNESGTNGPDTSLEANNPLTGCNIDGTEYFDRFNRSSALAEIEVMRRPAQLLLPATAPSAATPRSTCLTPSPAPCTGSRRSSGGPGRPPRPR